MIATLVRILGVAVVCAALIALPTAFGPEPAQARAQTPESRGFPILVLNCQTDPGGVGPNSGRGLAPGELESKYGCERAEGVAVTVYNLEVGYQARCETDSSGNCSVEGAPFDPDIKLSVVEHTATLAPGLAPRTAIVETANYTEYAGAGIVNLPVAATPGAESEAARQLLTVHLSGCPSGHCDAAAILAQVSPAEITSMGVPWLAPDADGAVTFDVAPLAADAIDLMFTLDAEPAVTCTDDTTGDSLPADWLTKSEGSFARIDLPEGGGNLSCDVAFG
ncbi:hypothetical protein BH09CHL1_BH09CHL1_06850 [soil metagenome]